MEIDKRFKGVICVYKITNKINGKIIIGSTKNLYNRISHYRSDINKINPLKHYNKELYNDILLYGINNFYIDIIEEYNNDITDIELKNKESQYIIKYKSNDSNIGYNIRLDINGKCITSDKTKEIKRFQTTQQWENGLRDGHSYKMKNYWKNATEERRNKQKERMSKNLTKFSYNVYDKNNNIIYENIGYKKLKDEGFNSVMSSFNRYDTINRANKSFYIVPKVTRVVFKDYIVERINLLIKI